FGTLPAEVATPLSMVLTELVQNAVEHAYPDGRTGRIEVAAVRDRDGLGVEVRVAGTGLPDGFDLATSPRLGLQIVRALVTGDLHGTLALRPRETGGTSALLSVPLATPAL
ncbi:MAG: ATP-binding protein, partial [Pseudorhodobacter sp.]|nr:ATP-binding protein [Frankiaceae bacterium]